MPGGEGFKEIGENEYTGLLDVKVGPVQGKFTGTIKLSEIVEPESYTMQVDGKGAPGFVKATGSLKLTGQGESTYMTYEGKAQIGGRIATVGQRLLESSTKSIIRQSLEGLNDYLKVQMAAQVTAEAAIPSTEQVAGIETSPEAPKYASPTQMSVAKNVFKDVANDIFPPQYRPVVIVGGVVVIILILYLILR
jgi:carbon monoxide dehydrogenase subunit G